MLPQNMQENSKNTPNISLPGGRSLIVTLYIISVWIIASKALKSKNIDTYYRH